MPDFSVRVAGVLYLFEPESAAANAWIDAHAADWMRCNGALVVEGDDAADVMVSMRAEGLVLH